MIFVYTSSKSTTMKLYLLSISLFLSTYLYSQNLYSFNSFDTSPSVNKIQNDQDVEVSNNAYLVDDTKFIEVISPFKVKVKHKALNHSVTRMGMSSKEWTDLNLGTEIFIHSVDNTNMLNVEGGAVIKGSKNQKISFEIGVFVDDNLYFSEEFLLQDSTSKFNLSGILQDLDPGKHSIKVFARGLSLNTLIFGNDKNEKENQLRLTFQQAD